MASNTDHQQSESLLLPQEGEEVEKKSSASAEIEEENTRTSQKEDEEEKSSITIDDADERFLSWYLKNGGWMSPKITLGNFEAYGKGLYVVVKKETQNLNNGDASLTSLDNHKKNNRNHVRKGEIMLQIPKKLVIAPDACIEKLQEIFDNDTTSSSSTSTSTTAASGDESSTLPPRRHNLQEMLKTIEANTIFTSQNLVTTLFIMWEMSLGQDSFYDPYLQTLPTPPAPLTNLDHDTTFGLLPSSFTNDELELFQETQYVSNAHLGYDPTQNFAENFHSIRKLAKASRDGQYKLWYGSSHDDTAKSETTTKQKSSPSSSTAPSLLFQSIIQRLQRKSPNPSFWTYANFDWCRQLVSSRSIAVTGGMTAIVPMADKINHNSLEKVTMIVDKGNGNFEPLNHIRNTTTGMVTIKADHPIQPGDQFMEMYGNINNQWFVTWAGFVPPINYFHYVSVPLPPLPSTVEPIRQVLNLPSIVDHAKVKSTKDALNSYVWQYLDLVLLAQSPNKVQMALASLYGYNDLTMLCEIVKVACQKTSYIHPKMRSIIQQGARTALSEYPKTLNEDKVILEEWKQKPKGTIINGSIRRDNAIVAIEFRIQEKEYLTRISNEIIDMTTNDNYDPSSSSEQNFSTNMVLVAIFVVVLSFLNNRKRNRHFTGVGRTASR